MKNNEKIEIYGICQALQMETEKLYGMIKCNPKLAHELGIFSLAHGIFTAALYAANWADIVEETDLADAIHKSCEKLSKVAEI